MLPLPPFAILLFYSILTLKSIKFVQIVLKLSERILLTGLTLCQQYEQYDEQDDNHLSSSKC